MGRMFLLLFEAERILSVAPKYQNLIWLRGPLHLLHTSKREVNVAALKKFLVRGFRMMIHCVLKLLMASFHLLHHKRHFSSGLLRT